MKIRRDRIGDGYVRGSLEVANRAGKMSGNKLKWNGDVERRNYNAIVVKIRVI